LPSLRADHLYPYETFLVPIFVRGWVDQSATVRPEELYQLYISITIEPATFRIVAQFLNQMRHRVPPVSAVNIIQTYINKQ